jgi:hypothetical protein
MSAACICFFAVHARVARVVEHWVGAGVRGLWGPHSSGL